MNAETWTEATNGIPWHKVINVRFLAEMGGDICTAEMTDAWGRVQMCIRLPGHTGRHLATNYNTDYPTAVWR